MSLICPSCSKNDDIQVEYSDLEYITDDVLISRTSIFCNQCRKDYMVYETYCLTETETEEIERN